MPEISAEIRGLLRRNVACSTVTRCNERPLLGFAGTYGRRALAAAGSRRRRGSVGAGRAGGASRVAELGARHAAAAGDAELQAAQGLLRPRVRVVRELAVVAFDKGSVADYSNAILAWWRDNCKTFPAWALAARIVFAISPNSASCERVFALLKNLFGEEQSLSLADYVQASLMLNYNDRSVG